MTMNMTLCAAAAHVASARSFSARSVSERSFSERIIIPSCMGIDRDIKKNHEYQDKRTIAMIVLFYRFNRYLDT